jgi:hypothetical protein
MEVDINNLSSSELEALLEKKKQEEKQKQEESRKAYEAMRNALVDKLTQKARELSGAIEAFNKEAFDELNALAELMREHAKSKRGKGKGNFTIDNADITRRIEFNRHQKGRFDERSAEAESLILEFVKKRFDADPAAQKMITSLLERKSGSLDIKLIQKLYAMENNFDDADWRNGIRLMKESWVDTNTKDYVRFYTMNEKGAWEGVLLDFANF